MRGIQTLKPHHNRDIYPSFSMLLITPLIHS